MVLEPASTIDARHCERAGHVTIGFGQAVG
jgi:hypothetical protein